MYFNLFSTGCAAACGLLRGGTSLLALPGFHVLFCFDFLGVGGSQPDSSHSLKLHRLKLPVWSGTKLLGVYMLGRNTHEPALHPSPRLSVCFFFFFLFFLYLYPASALLFIRSSPPENAAKVSSQMF